MVDRRRACALVQGLLWVGIQWRADDLLFDFETCPNYQKLPQIVTDLRQPRKIYDMRVNSVRH